MMYIPIPKIVVENLSKTSKEEQARLEEELQALQLQKDALIAAERKVEDLEGELRLKRALQRELDGRCEEAQVEAVRARREVVELQDEIRQCERLVGENVALAEYAAERLKEARAAKTQQQEEDASSSSSRQVATSPKARPRLRHNPHRQPACRSAEAQTEPLQEASAVLAEGVQDKEQRPEADIGQEGGTTPGPVPTSGNAPSRAVPTQDVTVPTADLNSESRAPGRDEPTAPTAPSVPSSRQQVLRGSADQPSMLGRGEFPALRSPSVSSSQPDAPAPSVDQGMERVLSARRDNEQDASWAGTSTQVGSAAVQHAREEEDDDDFLLQRVSSATPENASETTAEKVQNECIICKLEIERGEEEGALACSHCFHKDCIESWQHSQGVRCPVCSQNSAELMAAEAASTMQPLFVFSDMGYHGRYELVPDRRPGGMPLWQKLGVDGNSCWLFVGSSGQWFIGDEDEEAQGFDCDTGNVASRQKHEGRGPQHLPEGGWIVYDPDTEKWSPAPNVAILERLTTTSSGCGQVVRTDYSYVMSMSVRASISCRPNICGPTTCQSGSMARSPTGSSAGLGSSGSLATTKNPDRLFAWILASSPVRRGISAVGLTRLVTLVGSC
eukprot:TRINITY_DN24866_c0_g1_i4.p1 TRINITY_DN24866_c0_g1~~TRINITY_DN24866_c0_g1_i4.p1  ORF type:complete len:616 (-),score=118.97 TRINITY_DN24866_c0_g1_i4:1146-2993(-)